MMPYRHRLSENGSDFDVDPLPCGGFPVQRFIQPVYVVLNGVLVAEAYVEAMVVGRERVDWVTLDHVSPFRPFQLPQVSEPDGVEELWIKLNVMADRTMISSD